MIDRAGWYGGELRRELGARSRLWAGGRLHVQSYGNPPVIVFAPEDSIEVPPVANAQANTRPVVPRHGNFFDASYAAIAQSSDWIKRFGKIHAQGRSLPKPSQAAAGASLIPP